MFQIRYQALPANQNNGNDVDIIVCTTQGFHLLSQIPLASDFLMHHNTNVEPMLLGFECQAVLKSCLGKYDYYCYLEDDLVQSFYEVLNFDFPFFGEKCSPICW